MSVIPITCHKIFLWRQDIKYCSRHDICILSGIKCWRPGNWEFSFKLKWLIDNYIVELIKSFRHYPNFPFQNLCAFYIYWVLLITSSDRSNTRLHRGDFPSKSLTAMFKSLVMVQQTPAPGDNKQFSFNFFFVVILYVAIFSSPKRYGKITTLIWHFGIQNWALAKIHLCHREFVVL